MKVTVAQLVITHLNRYSAISPSKYDMPYAMTQDGIGCAVGISRAHACIALKKLAERGYVGSILSHVMKNGRQRMVFYLTPDGLRKAAELSVMFERQSVDIELVLNTMSKGETVRSPEYFRAEECLIKAAEGLESYGRTKDTNDWNCTITELLKAVKHMTKMGVSQ